MSEAEFLADGWEKVNLNEGNVNIGDNIVNGNGCFGTLAKITKKGKYAVRFDMDYSDEPLTKFSPAQFERFFLVDKR
jgi:hypothetical protein